MPLADHPFDFAATDRGLLRETAFVVVGLVALVLALGWMLLI